MNELNDFFKAMAEAKASDPKHKKIAEVKEHIKEDLGGLFSQISKIKAQDPVAQKAKKIEVQVKTNIKEDLNSLFAELGALKVQKDVMLEQHPELAVEPEPEPEQEVVNEDVLSEVAPVEEAKEEAKIINVDKYLTGKTFQQPEPDPVAKEFKAITDKMKFLEQAIAKIAAHGPGGGEVNLRYLDDVDRSTIGDGKYLNYNATTKKFQFSTLSGGGAPQVQSDWTESDNTELSFIKNKPTLFSGSYNDLTNTPSIPAAQVQSDWNQTTNTALDFIKNKPTIPSLTGYATESYVTTAIGNVIGAAPDALNTLKEIADQLATDESAVASLTTAVSGKVSLTGTYANPDWITSLAYSKLTGAPTLATVATTGSYTDLINKPTLFSGSYADLTNKPTIPTVPTLVSTFTNDSGYLTSVSWSQVSDKPQNILTLNDTNVVSNEMLVNDSITIGSTPVALGGSITSLTGLTGVTSSATAAFIAGDAAISNVSLQMPSESALRNLTNGFTNMYFDVSIGGTSQGAFQFRSSSSFTNVLTMSPTVFSVNTGATVTARTASLARTGFNSAIDTEITVDSMRFRISNQGGIFPQVIGNGSARNLAWTGVGAISGSAVTQVGSTGTIVADNAWSSLYTAQSMNSAGDTVTVTLQDKAAGRIYRITFMRSDNGSTTGYNIIAERLL